MKEYPKMITVDGKQVRVTDAAQEAALKPKKKPRKAKSKEE